MNYAIDGSNTLLGLKLNKKPSIRLLARLLLVLREHGIEFSLFFDNSIHTHMFRERLADDWKRFLYSLDTENIKPHFVRHADGPIAEYCKTNKAKVINFSDKMDSWSFTPTAHRVRALQQGRTLQLALRDDVTGRFVLRSPAHESFAFGVLTFPALDIDQVNLLERTISPFSEDAEGKDAQAQGTLLVLALDASYSMTLPDSYDGRPKSEHLNKIVQATTKRLRDSRINDGLYVAMLRFEDEVTPMFCPATNTKFASIFDWEKNIACFDYLTGITPRQTNIRLVLQRARELIQDTLTDSDLVDNLADDWRVIIVLITDGVHVAKRADGTPENDEDVARAALNIHECVIDSIGKRIDIGCVGIGRSVNAAILKSIASDCTPIQINMARNYSISHLLQDSKLFVMVDSNNQKFDEAIRSFIDVASS